MQRLGGAQGRRLLANHRQRSDQRAHSGRGNSVTFRSCSSAPTVRAYSFGILMRLIIKDPDNPNNSVNGCKTCPPTLSSPNHNCPPTAPSPEATAITHTRRNEVGIGVPSK